MNKNKKRFVRKMFNSAVKELRRKKQVTPKVYILGEDGKRHTFSPTYQNPFVKMLETTAVREMCKRVNATCVVSVGDCFTGNARNNIRPSLDPDREEAVALYYEDLAENYMMFRKYRRTGHDKIVFTGKAKKHNSMQGPLTNFLQHPEDDSPLAVFTNHRSMEATVWN